MTSIVNNPAFPRMLISQMIVDTAFIEKAVFALSPDEFSREEERPYKLAYTVLKEWWDTNRRPITEEILVAQITARLEGDPTFLSEEQKTELLTVTIPNAFTEYKAVPTRFMVQQLELFLHDRRVRPAAQKLSTTEPGAEFEKRLVELRQAEVTSKVSTGKIVDIFHPNKIAISAQPRLPTGLTVLDLLLGGGRRPGEVYGFIGPSGGGKTTLSVQAFVQSAKQKAHSAYFTYETDFQPELSNRIYSFAAGFGRKDIEGKDLETMAPQHLDELKRCLGEYGEYFHAVDMKSGGAEVGIGGADEVAAQLREFDRRGTHIDFLIIDQYLPMIDRYIAARNLSVDNRRVIMQQMVQQFMDIAQPSNLNCTILLVHQTGTAAAAKAPTNPPEIMDAAECKSFPFWMTNCLALGTLDHNNVCWITSTKARNTAKSQYAIRLNGEFNRFEYETCGTGQDRYIAQQGARAFTDIKMHNTTTVVAHSTIEANNKQVDISKYT